jgi:hypothetical protein
MRGSTIVRPGVLAAGLVPLRPVRGQAGQAERRALDGRHDGGQRRAGVRRGLALFLLFLRSRRGSGQPLTHPAQPPGLRPGLEDAIHGVEHQYRADEAANEQANHECPPLAR